MQLNYSSVMSWHGTVRLIQGSFCDVGGSSGTVGVLRSNKHSGNNSSNTHKDVVDTVTAATVNGKPADAAAWQHDPHVQQLVSYGYPPKYAMSALQLCGGSLVQALHHLQQQLITASSSLELSASQAVVYPAAGTAGDSDTDLPQAWLDELEVLSAIYDQQLQCHTPGMISLTVDVGEQVSSLMHLQAMLWNEQSCASRCCRL